MTTSGTHCPFLGYPAAMALVDIGFRDRGQRWKWMCAGAAWPREVVKLPFINGSNLWDIINKFLKYNKEQHVQEVLRMNFQKI